MSPKIIILSAVGFFVIMIGAALLISAGQKPEPPKAVFSSQDQDRPKVETTQIFFNMGEIKVSDVKQADFQFKNSGTQPLQILNINSSCGCTTGQIIYNDFTSKEYGMHNQSGFVTEIAPGTTATLRLIYRPATMPVYGLVEREVYVNTNDPDKAKLIFAIKANVK